MRLEVTCRSDTEHARRTARDLARSLGFASVEAEMVALAVGELAANLVRYAEEGQILLTIISGPLGAGVEVESRDVGPGIVDLALALVDGFTTGGGLGSGLPAVRRLMDEFEIDSTPTGSRIIARKWKPHR